MKLILKSITPNKLWDYKYIKMVSKNATPRVTKCNGHMKTKATLIVPNSACYYYSWLCNALTSYTHEFNFQYQNFDKLFRHYRTQIKCLGKILYPQ